MSVEHIITEPQYQLCLPSSDRVDSMDDYVTDDTMDPILQELETQLAMYEAMVKKEWDSTGGETHGTCAYLEGTVVASRRALEMARRLRR